VLAVTDPCAVAPRVDGVMLVVCISKRSRADALRATKILNTLDTNLLGVVVNRKTDDRSNYGRKNTYGGYEYGGYEVYGQRADESGEAHRGADLLSQAGTSQSTSSDKTGAARNGHAAVAANGDAPW
jgi:Mrp family chromosome partitioning ATPase